MAAATPVKVQKSGRGGFRLIIALLVVILIIGGLLFGLNIAASAATNVGATLTVFLPSTSISRAGAAYVTATSGAVAEPGDSVKTDAKGRAQVKLPDGTIVRLANSSEITLSASHFGKDGNLHDVSVLEKVGRTLTTVQHLAGGATFQVKGNSTTASVRGTEFEVVVNPDGSVLVKLFTGGLDLDGSGHAHLNAGQQVSIDANGTIGAPVPIVPDPNDPFGPDIAASQAVQSATTPGTEQDNIGLPLHDKEQQQFTYSFAGGSDIKVALAYPGSVMQLKVEAPDGHPYISTGPSPIVIVIPNPPAGIYKIDAIGISGLGTAGETPFISVAALEPCATSNIEQNGAVRHSYTGPELAQAVSVPGLTNLKINIIGSSPAGAILEGSANYNGVGLTGSLLLYTHSGNLAIIPLAATAFGLNIPAQQAAQQISSALGDDPANLNVGFSIDRLFSCNGVLMMDGHSA